jgi:hypothetical protein
MEQATEPYYGPLVRFHVDGDTNYAQHVHVYGFRGANINPCPPETYAEPLRALALVWNSVPILLARIEQLETELERRITRDQLLHIVAQATRDIPANEGADEWYFLSDSQKAKCTDEVAKWLRRTFPDLF